jgi:hypothetical protein
LTYPIVIVNVKRLHVNYFLVTSYKIGLCGIGVKGREDPKERSNVESKGEKDEDY